VEKRFLVVSLKLVDATVLDLKLVLECVWFMVTFGVQVETKNMTLHWS
jgi:hypothetical protein